MSHSRLQSLPKEEALRQIEAIYQNFSAKLEQLKKDRDKKITALLSQAEERRLVKTRESLKNIR
ncbi:MAG: hypothetical protein PHN39_01045 [Candidatus Pacebacteria bacterium]|nr:hypothetical protein [Candidatus Paceibacterota bacterium]